MRVTQHLNLFYIYQLPIPRLTERRRGILADCEPGGAADLHDAGV